MSGARVHVVFDHHGEVTEYELRPRHRPELTQDEELELAALCGIAWERRSKPDFRERVDDVLYWHDRRHVRALERRQRSHAAVLQVLRETNPQPKGRRAA